MQKYVQITQTCLCHQLLLLLLFVGFVFLAYKPFYTFMFLKSLNIFYSRSPPGQMGGTMEVEEQEVQSWALFIQHICIVSHGCLVLTKCVYSFQYLLGAIQFHGSNVFTSDSKVNLSSVSNVTHVEHEVSAMIKAHGL